MTLSGPSISAIMLCSLFIPYGNYSVLDSSLCWHNNHHVKGFFDRLVMYPKLIWKIKKVQSAKFVRKKRIYLKEGSDIHPFLWIEFLDDGSFSLGFMSKEVKLTEYGSAIQQGAKFTQHAQIVRRGNVTIDETEAPHFTFHPPRISQKSGMVHMVDATGKIDEWEFDWFPVRKVDHFLTVYSGQLSLLGTVARPRKNFSIIAIPPGAQGIRMDMFICPAGPQIVLDSLAIDNVFGGCKHYNLVCNFYRDSSAQFSIYVATEMRTSKSHNELLHRIADKSGSR